MTAQAIAAGKTGSRTEPKFWDFIDNGDDTAELQLFGTISSQESWWDDDCVTYRNFINDLNGLGDKKTINVTIQSGGGDVFAANAIYTALMTNRARITGTVIGICASAATIILMACDDRKIAENAVLMVHNPSVSLFGSYQTEDLMKMAEVTEQVKKSIMTAYMSRLDKTEDEISQLMDEETWYVGQEAVDAGFCDSVVQARFTDNVSGQFFIDGAPHTFKDYMETAVPEDVRDKARSLSRRPPTAIEVMQQLGVPVFDPQGEPIGLGTIIQQIDGALRKCDKGQRDAFMDILVGGRYADVLDGLIAGPDTVERGAAKKTERKTGMDEKNMVITEIAGLRAAYPQLCAQIAAEAVETERERLKAIDEIAAGIPQETLTRAKYEEPISAADLALAQMKANNAAGQQFLAGMAADMQDSGTASVTADPNVGFDDAVKQREESEKKVGGLVASLKKDKRRG